MVYPLSTLPLTWFSGKFFDVSHLAAPKYPPTLRASFSHKKVFEVPLYKIKERRLPIKGKYNILLVSRFSTVVRNQFRNVNFVKSAQQVYKNVIGEKLLHERSRSGFQTKITINRIVKYNSQIDCSRMVLIQIVHSV